MKQDLSVMKAVVVSFQMAPAVSKYMAYNGKNIFVRTLNFHSYSWKLRVLNDFYGTPCIYLLPEKKL